LGDCYFLAALASMAAINNGKFIRDMFYTKKDNANHIFATRWVIDGKIRFVTIDDFEPGANGKSVFSTAKDN
jgi:GH43 family beta-xylosidase